MKRLAIYLAVTFGLTWGLQIPAGISMGAFQNGLESSATMVAVVGLSMFFPLVGALAAYFAFPPKERIDLCWKPLIRENVFQYLAAWFLPAAIAIAGCAVFFLANPQLFDPSLTAYAESTAAAAGVSTNEVLAQMPPAWMVVLSTVVLALIFAPFINMIPAFGEELGWRGMLFPTLAERMSERNAALVSGIIWGIWHAPVIIMGHNYGMGYPGFPIAGILTMILACTAMGCWLCYLRVRTESVWPCAVAHGSFNAIANIGSLFCVSGLTLFGPNPLGLVAGIPLIIVGAFCWLRLSSEPHSK